MTPEERADLQREEARIAEALAALEADLTAAYNVLCEVMPGRPATVKAAAEKAAKMIRDHNAERRRVLAELDAARAECARLDAEGAAEPERLRVEIVRAAGIDPHTAWGDLPRHIRVRIDVLQADADGWRDERDAARGQLRRVRARHAAQCGGVCDSTPCECGSGDLVCAECETPHPCPTLIDLDGTEGTP